VVLLVLASCGQQGSVGSKTHYIPSDALTTEGDNGLSTFWDDNHWATQIVFEETLLDGMPVGATIIGMRIRLGDDLAGGAQDAFVPDTIEKLEVRLSSSVNGPGSLSDTFADNQGADEVIVIPERSWEIAADDYDNCDGNCEFGPFMRFNNPFVYAGGDLLLEVAHSGGTNIRYMDAELVASDNIIMVDLSIRLGCSEGIGGYRRYPSVYRFCLQ
jgi:hypothetical protein